MYEQKYIKDNSKKTYIQSAYAPVTEEKKDCDLRPFALTGDSFLKILIRHDVRKSWYDDTGTLNIGAVDFLLDESIL